MDDDDMVLVIVGNEEVPVDNVETPIRNEPVDDLKGSITDQSVAEILKQAEKHGQYISLDTKEVMEGCEYELLDDVPIQLTRGRGNKSMVHTKAENVTLDDNKDYISSDEEFSPDYYEVYNKSQKKRQAMLGKNERKSYVAQLRKECPELKDDALLQQRLSEVMLAQRPPTLPPDFCKVVEDNDITKFQCCVCGSRKESMTAVNRHYQERHGPRYLICYACGVDFRSTTNLYKHEKRCIAPDANTVVHARALFLAQRRRERPHGRRNSPSAGDNVVKYYCSQCPAAFSLKTTLISHENCHAGYRPYRCDICPAAYTSECGLKRHKHIHSGNIFVCDHCGRTFNRKGALVAHFDTHLPLRKYGCDKCSRRFAQKNALQHHMNRDHLMLPPAFGCPVCPKRYPRMTHVKDHMKKHHGLTMITRKMFLKSLPTLDEIAIQEAKVVLQSETEAILPQTEPHYLVKSLVSELLENGQVNETVDNNDQDINDQVSEIPDTQKQVSDQVYQVLDNDTNVKNQVYTIHLEGGENAEMMDKFLEYVQTNIEPGAKVIKIENGVFEEVNIDSVLRA